jgi:hypothetical protein
MMHSRQRIDRYLAGEVSGEAALRHHLWGCEACRTYYDEGVRALRAARGSTISPGAGELERIVRRARALALNGSGARRRSPTKARARQAEASATSGQ